MVLTEANVETQTSSHLTKTTHTPLNNHLSNNTYGDNHFWTILAITYFCSDHEKTSNTIPAQPIETTNTQKNTTFSLSTKPSTRQQYV